MEILIFWALIIAAMWFLLIRPQQQRAKAQRNLIQSLEVGDEVVTVGGLIGRIAAVDDEIVELDVADGVRLRYRRPAISGRLSPSPMGEAGAADEGGSEGEDR